MEENIISQQAPLIWEEINKAEKILLTLHVSPDVDSLGSCLAMKGLLEEMGKQVVVIAGDSLIPMYIKNVPGWETVVEKNISEINWSDWDLFMMLDSGSLSQVSQKVDLVFPENLATVVIDHHPSNPGYGKVNLVDGSKVSVCEILYELMQIWKVEITQEMASCMYVGIYGDSGGFCYPPTSARTLEIATNLVKINPEAIKLIEISRNMNDKKQIITQAWAVYKAREILEGRVAVAVLDLDGLAEIGVGPGRVDGGNIANILKSAIGWEVGVCMQEKNKGEFRLSMRTRDPVKYSVRKIAEKFPTGGGHDVSAGATLTGVSTQEAIDFLTKAIEEVWERDGVK